MYLAATILDSKTPGQVMWVFCLFVCYFLACNDIIKEAGRDLMSDCSVSVLTEIFLHTWTLPSKEKKEKERREGREREPAGGECAASARPDILVHVMFTAFLPSR